MNKKALTALTAIALAAALTACGKDTPDNIKPETDLPSSLSTDVTATDPAETAETTETTPPETTAPAPLPEVKDGTVYTKKAIDAYDGGLDFLHSLTIPRIDSTLPGAEALNAKMLAEQQDKLDALAANKEENYLYTVTYSSSGADGILVINVYEYTGWQYSEGGSTRRFYYYDAAADRELTLDETLAKLSMTKESLNRAFAWSSEYAAISIEYPERTRPLSDAIFGAPVTGTPENTKFYYAETKSGNEADLLGIDFDDKTISPCYHYAIYTVGTITCPIDRTNGQPLHPYYECTLDAADLQTGDAFRITVTNGKVTEAIVPADAQVQHITISSDGISILYGKDASFDFSGAELRVNGERVSGGSSSGLADAEDAYSTYRYMPNYIPLDKLDTIEFITKTAAN